MEGMALDDVRYVLLAASDEEVGPACMNVPVPPTIADDEDFREVYCQGWRHALAAARRALASDENRAAPDGV